jgi:hypothetical protein
LPKASVTGKRIEVNMKLNIGPNTRAVRLVGRSIQPGLHHYKVLSNPIFISRNTVE